MIHKKYLFVAGLAGTLVFSSCTESDQAPGLEYMPDMYRSPALEAYIDYGSNKHMDLTQEEKNELGVVPVLSRLPVDGTVPFMGSEMAIFAMPYPLNNTVEDYERAAAEIKSPLLSTKVNVERGKELYTHMCMHCHGKDGHGDGPISKNGHIPGIPDYATKLKDLPEGKMYHTIMYGKGLMGQHASQLSAQERWQVISYVKCLQQGVSSPEYDANGMVKLKATAAPADTTAKNG
jgi:mono/diheme cytochrome c family protein